MFSIRFLWESLLHVAYPRICSVCDLVLEYPEEIICSNCFGRIPQTQFHLDTDNEMKRKLSVIRGIKGAAAFFYFEKQGPVQELIHQIKYYDKTEVADELGKKFGEQLKTATPFTDADFIIPVPLHRKKEHLRGYNQSLYFAQGLSKSMEIPVCEKELVRIRNTETQTNKSRIERIKNMENAFKVSDAEKLKDKKLMLVDDVMTTGATLLSCAEVLLKTGAKEVSIITLAYTI